MRNLMVNDRLYCDVGPYNHLCLVPSSGDFLLAFQPADLFSDLFA